MNDKPDNPDRSSHFQGFAKLLWIEIVQSEHFPTVFITDKGIQELKLLISERAYDLMIHVLSHAIDSFDPGKDAEVIEGIPDMTELPTPQ